MSARGWALRSPGVRPGVPDVVLPAPYRGFGALYLELKSATGRVTDTQVWWIRRLRTAGNAVAVCKGWDRARAVLEWYVGATDVEPVEVREAW